MTGLNSRYLFPPLLYSNASFKTNLILRFLNVLASLNGFIIKRIVFLFLVKYIASGTLMLCTLKTSLILYVHLLL